LAVNLTELSVIEPTGSNLKMYGIEKRIASQRKKKEGKVNPRNA
jgi:hypothetical protein